MAVPFERHGWWRTLSSSCKCNRNWRHYEERLRAADTDLCLFISAIEWFRSLSLDLISWQTINETIEQMLMLTVFLRSSVCLLTVMENLALFGKTFSRAEGPQQKSPHYLWIWIWTKEFNADPSGGEKLSESQTGFISSLLSKLCLNTSHRNTSTVALKVLSIEATL